MPVELAHDRGDKFQTREAMRNDRLSDLDARHGRRGRAEVSRPPLSKEQLAEFIQIPPR